MKAFKRVFKYVWPQWHRLVTIACSVFLIMVLYGLSFGTISPLLTVMMGSEGLHGWMNRKISVHRYGISFYVPDSTELSDPNVAYFLRIAGVKKDSVAEQAGLKQQDLIVGAGSSIISENDRIQSSILLEELATISNVKSIAVQYRRLDEYGQFKHQPEKLELRCGKKPFYSDHAQKLLSFIPKERTRENKKKAVISIILLMAVVTMVRCMARFYQDYTASKVVSTPGQFGGRCI